MDGIGVDDINVDNFGGDDVGVLVVGHGTRDRLGQAQMRNLACQTAGCVAPLKTELGFLELARPTIAEGVQSLARAGIKRLITVPALLFRAGHADHDIPEAVAAAAAQCHIQLLAQTPPLEHQPTVLELSAGRFREALEAALGPAKSAELPPERISLAMISRGSSSDSAAAAMERLAQLRCQLTPVASCQVGFVAVRQPNVAATLDWLARQPASVLVVQPHLLFEGEVFHSLCTAVEQRQRCDQRRWIMCQPLGAPPEQFDDHRLAEVLAQLARDSVAATL